MLKTVVFLVAFSSALHDVRGYPDALFNGAARLRACDNLSPNHGVVPQTSRSPFVLDVSYPYWIPSEGLGLILKGTNGNSFRGFMIQARSRKNPSKMIGHFMTVDGTRTNCEGNRALTHSNNDEKHFLRLTWQAPSTVLSGDVQFLYTVVKDKGTFWVNQTSAYLPTYYDYVARPETTTMSRKDQMSGSARITANISLLIVILALLI